MCDQQMANACVTTWQSMGYGELRALRRRTANATECPPLWGYMCGIGPYDATKPDVGTRPW